jgi:hypothetical protein
MLMHICAACGVVNRICGKNNAPFLIQKIFQMLDILNICDGVDTNISHVSKSGHTYHFVHAQFLG